MKAWHVFCGDPQDGSLLIYANARNRARTLWFKGPYTTDFYLDVQARRASQWDGAYAWEMVIETNDEIPENYADFYEDEV